MLDSYRDSKGKKALEFPHFPTRMQAFVWRNWGLVPVGRLAAVLQATEAQIGEMAREMGLAFPQEADPRWLTRGYITIIRANWHLLPYGQLLQLLDWTETQLAFALKEDDFLWVKLGYLKPEAEELVYRPLTADEREQTVRLRERIAFHFPEQAGDSAGEALGFRSSIDEPFGFLQRFRQVGETAAGKPAAAAQPLPDGIALDASWRIQYSPGYTHVPKFAERFAAGLERKWGIRLGAPPAADAPSASAAPELRLEVVPDAALLAESHEVEATPQGIAVRAVDEPGLLRALQWIERQMELRGAPVLAEGLTRRSTKFDLRYVYSYFAVYGDPLIDPELDPYPDELLERLSGLGVNGVWLQSVLYNLIPWDEAPELSAGWERRLNGLRKLVDRAADYGIGIYLYYNEPRAMPLAFFDKRPEWKGHAEGIDACLCTSHPEVRHYLRESTARLFEEVPGLAGLFTITMSENLTNCYSRAPGGKTNCPRCAARPREEVVAEVNRCIAEGAFRAKPDARVICWTWGWNGSDEELSRAISLLPDGVRVMCTSEERMKTNVAGVEGFVLDYSISNVGPGERSRKNWETAAARGLATVAKVQLNNTWECSAVPYLPVFELVGEHLANLQRSGVSGLMLSWTLGGYPSLNLELASELYWSASSPDGTENPEGRAVKEQENRFARKFGRRAGAAVAEASRLFSAAFREFPFHVSVAYTAPQNFGPANLLWLQPTGYSATMIGYPYDDLKRWRSIYPDDKFAAQFRKLSQGWKRGLGRLEQARRHVPAEAADAFADLAQAAYGAYCHFRSTYLQIAFVRSRDRRLLAKSAKVRETERRRLLAVLDEEIGLAQSLHELVRRDSRIGYEASNHYFYTTQDLREKTLNALYLRDLLQQEP